MGCKYVNEFQFPKSAGFKRGGCVKKAEGGAVTPPVAAPVAKPVRPNMPDRSNKGGAMRGLERAAAMSGHAVGPDRAAEMSGRKLPPKVPTPVPPTPAPATAAMKKGGMAKVGKVMGEFASGKLHSGSKAGPVVKSRKQAIAIAMSEAGKSKKK